jgi:hypothetical protein
MMARFISQAPVWFHTGSMPPALAPVSADTDTKIWPPRLIGVEVQEVGAALPPDDTVIPLHPATAERVAPCDVALSSVYVMLPEARPA